MGSIIFFVLLTTVAINAIKYSLAIEDPDVNRNVSQLISSKGFPVEEYNVQTSDGYILGIQRIPYGRNNSNGTIPNKKVLLLQHGLMGSSADFVINFEDNSLGFVLANAGYDVWLGNSRGNAYALKHIKYNTNQRIFWQFSYDEMALYDLPATINFILNFTGQQQLYFVGHSQGTACLFAMLCELPQYNSKIKAAIALAPVAFEGHLKGLLRLGAPFASMIKAGLYMLRQYEFFSDDGAISKGSELLCGTTHKIICKAFFYLTGVSDFSHMNETRLNVYFTHFPSGTSTMTLVHHAQAILSKNFQKYDYGLGNLRKYNKLRPPMYQLSRMTAPIALIWGQSDLLANPEDVALLKPHIKNLIAYYKVPSPKWSHYDFVAAKDGDKYL